MSSETFRLNKKVSVAMIQLPDTFTWINENFYSFTSEKSSGAVVT